MNNTIGAVSNADVSKTLTTMGTPRASAATGAPINMVNASAAEDTYTAQTTYRVGDRDYDSLFEGAKKEGRVERSTGGGFSELRTVVEREYKDGTLDREIAWTYNNSWLGLSQKLSHSVESRQTEKGVEKRITYYGHNENPISQVYCLNGEHISTTGYGVYEQNQDITYNMVDGTASLYTRYDNGASRIENLGPVQANGQRETLSISEFERNELNGRSELVRSRINYGQDNEMNPGGYSLSEFTTDAEGIPKRIKEDVYRFDGSLQSSFVDYQNGRTKYKEFAMDGETVTYEYPPSFN